ncbi:hypothetical protein BC832DRAFT_595700 [Gaertneriomyces semiglobifer]|nr:hypothetical protein BC832DRAFT_595700 [Gaertneriomyces semiglobifer]
MEDTDSTTPAAAEQIADMEDETITREEGDVAQTDVGEADDDNDEEISSAHPLTDGTADEYEAEEQEPAELTKTEVPMDEADSGKMDIDEADNTQEDTREVEESSTQLEAPRGVSEGSVGNDLEPSQAIPLEAEGSTRLDDEKTIQTGSERALDNPSTSETTGVEEEDNENDGSEMHEENDVDAISEPELGRTQSAPKSTEPTQQQNQTAPVSREYDEGALVDVHQSLASIAAAEDATDAQSLPVSRPQSHYRSGTPAPVVPPVDMPSRSRSRSISSRASNRIASAGEARDSEGEGQRTEAEVGLAVASPPLTEQRSHSRARSISSRASNKIASADEAGDSKQEDQHTETEAGLPVPRSPLAERQSHSRARSVSSRTASRAITPPSEAPEHAQQSEAEFIAIARGRNVAATKIQTWYKSTRGGDITDESDAEELATVSKGERTERDEEIGSDEIKEEAAVKIQQWYKAQKSSNATHTSEDVATSAERTASDVMEESLKTTWASERSEEEEPDHVDEAAVPDPLDSTMEEPSDAPLAEEEAVAASKIQRWYKQARSQNHHVDIDDETADDDDADHGDRVQEEVAEPRQQLTSRPRTIETIDASPAPVYQIAETPVALPSVMQRERSQFSQSIPSTIMAMQMQIDLLTSEQSHLQTRIQNLETDRQLHLISIQRLTSKNTELQTTVQSLHSKIETLQEEKIELTKFVDELKLSIHKLESKLGEVEERNAGLSYAATSIDPWKLKLQTTEEKLTRLQKENETLKAQKLQLLDKALDLKIKLKAQSEAKPRTPISVTGNRAPTIQKYKKLPGISGHNGPEQ